MVSALKFLRRSVLTLFFHLLYHSFAWIYDLVSWSVSLGRWNQWIHQVIPFITGDNILELGHGPGHLQLELAHLKFLSFAIDESRQMGRLSNQRLTRNAFSSKLARAKGQALPFKPKAFDTAVATFPTEYIFELPTLFEINRTLKDGGRLVILASAWITGGSLIDRSLSLLFKITGQVPGDLEETRVLEPFRNSGFQANLEWVELPTSRLLLIVAQKEK
jgi:ubiquinone/menaquinone biosynthesis C-methylase UbiE